MILAERDVLAIFVATAVAVLSGIILFDPASLISVIALPAVCGVLVLTWGVFRGNRVAVLLLLFIAIFMLQAVFRVRDYQDKDIDFQVLLKIVIWIAVVGVAFSHVTRWLSHVLVAGNIPWILFVLWLFATAVVSPSPSPAYSAVSAFTVFACVVFSAYLFSSFDEVEIFAVIVAAITAFCAISIVVYFAIPQFGHYVYWVNEQRFVSPRLAGIAGSANNMALIASFSVVVTGLYAREFHRRNVFFAPVAGLISLTALVMTISRGPLVAAMAILFIVYMLHWKRLYATFAAISVGLLGLAAIILKGEAFLMKAVSRSGDVGEITSFTGRTEIWKAVLKLSAEEPWTGYGYASSVFVLPRHVSQVGFITSHAHNMILQLLFTTGIIGVVLFLLSMTSVIVRSAIDRDRTRFAMLLFVIFNGITESSGFTTLANICSFAFAIAVTLPPLERNRIEYENDLAYQRGFS
ncbi:MAG: O-antigen ligase family protein [Pseudorhodoplanes sp.]